MMKTFKLYICEDTEILPDPALRVMSKRVNKAQNGDADPGDVADDLLTHTKNVLREPEGDPLNAAGYVQLIGDITNILHKQAFRDNSLDQTHADAETYEQRILNLKHRWKDLRAKYDTLQEDSDNSELYQECSRLIDETQKTLYECRRGGLFSRNRHPSGRR